jgi:hypothetical protein
MLRSDQYRRFFKVLQEQSSQFQSHTSRIQQILAS